MGREKRKYKALGVLIGLLSSTAFEIYVFSTGQEKFFSRSPSGIKFSFALLPLFLIVGYIGGYAYWFIFKKKG